MAPHFTRRRRTSLLITGLWLGLAACQAWALTPEEVFRKVAPAVWTVKGERGNNQTAIGSAVAVTSGALATACHVVDGAVAVTVVQGPTTLRIARIVRDPDPSRDLCVLTSETPLQLPAVQIVPTAELRVGQRVFAVGSPHGLERTLSEGLISALRPRAPGQLPIVQTSAPVSSGSSGGGLFDTEGRLVGVTDSVAPGGANLGFAYPAQWVMELPQRVTTELATWRDLLKSTGVVFGPNGEPAPSGHAELSDLQALPSIGADPTPVRNAYRQFLLQARPRIFLLTGDQKFGTATSSAALTEHLKGCTERKVTCAAYAVDDTVVWGKQQAAK
ncbi:serine protease [Variovorax sp. KBS0712]|uniref:trypsin-like peptidase domain-containing protein n=1 Tax=Variovorax TaxID=34072 RepID=UPI0009ED9A5C|nr:MULTISPECIES: trypsin-like peptidase domain-containing protein [Variovorax]TSD56629.1 serine protease [Variovorax sp. KBS0712]